MVRKGSVLAIVVALAVAVTGCGTKEEKVVIADPVAETLAHAPADAAALAVVATDTAAGSGAALARLGGRFGGIELVVGQAQTTLGKRLGLDYATELRPLLGHPLVLWSTDGSVERRFAAWVVRDGGKLGELLAARERSGALVAAPGLAGYALSTRRGGGAYARRGPVLVSAPDLAALRDVLRRRRADRGQWSPRLLRERGLGLPEGVVARVALDARALVARRGGSARRVPWIAALERMAVTITPEAGGLRVHARASTDAGALAASDVPIAPGVEPPVTRGRGRLVAAVRDPQQTLRFARRVVDLLDPQRLDGLRRAEEVLSRFARVSVQEDLVERLSGNATLTSRDGRTFTLRADLDDPKVTADALDRLGTLARFGGPLAGLAGVDLGGVGVDAQDGGRYVVTRDGRLLVALAVVDGALVASTDPDSDLAAAARAPAAPRPPTAGAFRATVDAGLVNDVLAARLGLSGLGRAALAPVGDLIVTARGERELFDAQFVLPIAR
jgi:hypothetical protein